MWRLLTIISCELLDDGAAMSYYLLCPNLH